MTCCKEAPPPFSVDTPLTPEQAQALVHEQPDQAIWALLQLSAEVIRLRALHNADAQAHGPNTPSGAIPPYLKPNKQDKESKGKKGKRKSKRGAKQGHAGSSRPSPEPNGTQDHIPERCPDCQTPLEPPPPEAKPRTRVVEDLPPNIQAEVIEHRIFRAWCKTCRKLVEARIEEALPGSQMGNRLLSVLLCLRFGLGITLNKILETVNCFLQFPLTPGGMVQSAHRLAKIFQPWYEQIRIDLQASGILNADETGWRIYGVSFWLWCFTSRLGTYFQVDRSRGSPALMKFFTEFFSGVLISDFWSSYNNVDCAARQTCLPHLFRDLTATSKKDTAEEWQAFCKSLRRILNDAVRKRKVYEEAGRVDEADSAAYRERLKARIAQLIKDIDTRRTSKNNKNVQRLTKRLRRHQDTLFTFLESLAIPSDNNGGEREIRPAVIIRKNSYGNQSEQGAETMAIWMSIYRTLKIRGYAPIDEIEKALRHYSKHGVLPPLPPLKS